MFERLSHFLLREPRDREQLVGLLRDAEQRHLLDAHALAMIEGVLQVSEMQVRDIMVPRAQVVAIEHDANPAEFFPIIIDSGHSRFPVIGNKREEVIGIVLAKDMLKYYFTKEKIPFDINDYLRPAVFVPESKRLDTLLQEFRNKRNHMAIVVDEYGHAAGLITIEDVLEQIVGEIEDEYDIEEETNIHQHSDTQFTVKGLTPIEEFNEYFGSNFSNEEFDTIGGYVTHHFNHLPTTGESTLISDFRFKVLNTDKRRIRLLRVARRKKEPRG